MLKKSKNHFIQASLTFLVSALLFIACSEQENTEEIKKAIPVKTVSVKKEKLSLPIHTSGKLSSAKEIKLSFKTPGIIQKILVNEGRSVKRGTILAQLDLSEINSQVTQANQGYEKAQRDFERVKSLYADSVVTLEQLQNVETALQVAKSQLSIAKFNQKHSTIIAPTNGKILKRFSEEGELTNAGMPVIFFGTSNSDWIVRVGVTDREVVKLKIGDKADVFIDAYPNKTFFAKIKEIAEAANPMNGTYEIELELVEKDVKLVSGFIVKVDIFSSKKEEYYIVPIDAIAEADEIEATLYTISKNNTAKKIKVTIAEIINGKVTVKTGLENVETVITDGVEYLTNGIEIRLLKAGKPETGDRIKTN